MKLGRTVFAGLGGGLAANVMMLLTFRLMGFGWNGGGVLLDPSRQSPKLIAVWTQMEPLPLVVTRPLPIVLGFFIFSISHAFLYCWLAPHWPAGVRNRSWRFGAVVFFLSYVFWEFFTPFNQFGEPLELIALELTFWLMIALSEAGVISWIMESKK